MATKLLLTDHWTNDLGVTLAGAVFPDGDTRLTSLNATKAPLVNYTEATFNPVVQAYFAQRKRLPNGSQISLADMLRAQGLIT